MNIDMSGNVNIGCLSCLHILCIRKFLHTWYKDIFIEGGMYGTVLVFLLDIVKD